MELTRFLTKTCFVQSLQLSLGMGSTAGDANVGSSDMRNVAGLFFLPMGDLSRIVRAAGTRRGKRA